MYKHLIYRGFDIQETEQSWIISMNSDGETSYKNYPATELLKKYGIKSDEIFPM